MNFQELYGFPKQFHGFPRGIFIISFKKLLISKGIHCNSIYFLRNSMDSRRSSMDFVRDSVDFLRISMKFRRNFVDFLRSALDFRRNSIDEFYGAPYEFNGFP